ncbi:MAG: thermonuclease family protein [Pyrinomonadaceae bacterium]
MPEFSVPPQNHVGANIGKILAFSATLIFGIGTIVLLIGFPEMIGLSAANRPNFVSIEKNSDSSLASESEVAPVRPHKYSVQGKVVSVDNGNLITVLDEIGGQEEKVKLAGLTIPENGVGFGQKAQNELTQMLLNKTVFVLIKSVDEKGQSVGKVLLDDRDINLELLKMGLVSLEKNDVAKLPEVDQNLYVEAEKEARTARLGLWSGADSPVLEKTEETGVDLTGQPPQKENQPLPPAVKNKKDNNTTVSKNESGGERQEPRGGETAKKAAGSESAPTAQCADGTLSYSKTRSGTCSNHGGVSQWLGSINQNVLPQNKVARKYQLGPRGGCFYVNSKGSKTYVDKSFCN